MFWILLLSVCQSDRIHEVLRIYPFDIPGSENLITYDTNSTNLYDQNSFRSFNLEITQDNLQVMTEIPTEEKKVQCNIITDYNTEITVTLTNVECSFKGSVGSLRICFDEYNNFNMGCRRLSLEVKTKTRKYIFNGMPFDLSMVSERTSFYLMKSFGMYTPVSVHAKLFLNRRYLGVYSFVEPIDKNFLNNYFPNEKGALYKDLWFNSFHTSNLKDIRKIGSKKDDAFIEEIMRKVRNVGLKNARIFLDNHFDMDSFVNLTAFNTIIGNTDDWRQRHNFYIYITDNKKLVFIPWDYDRLNDVNSQTRGALRGRPWWNINDTSSTECNRKILTSEEKANLIGKSPLQIQWYKNIFDELPIDSSIPVICDKITKLLAYSYKDKVRERTLFFLSQLDLMDLRTKWIEWNSQIMDALQFDIAGPSISVMYAEQERLYNSILLSMRKALAEL